MDEFDEISDDPLAAFLIYEGLYKPEMQEDEEANDDGHNNDETSWESSQGGKLRRS